jgi:hypothetical protein
MPTIILQERGESCVSLQEGGREVVKGGAAGGKGSRVPIRLFSRGSLPSARAGSGRRRRRGPGGDD